MGKNTSYGDFDVYHSPTEERQKDFVDVLNAFDQQTATAKTDDELDRALNAKQERARVAGKSLSLFGALFRKRHTKIGRFGQKTISKEDDASNVFGDLDQKNASVKYFDPFKNMENKRETNEGGDDRTGDLKNSFRQRTRKNEQLVSESDFERSQLTDDAKMFAYVAWAAQNGNQNFLRADNKVKLGVAEQFTALFDNSKEFEPDYMRVDEKAEPNQFEVVVAVQPPTDVYLDYNKQVTKETNYVFKSLKPDYRKILDENVKKSASYAELVAKGKEEAAAVNATYDPDMDPNIAMLRAQVIENIEHGEGHSFVRMVAKEDGKNYSSYSFGFWPLIATPGIGGVTVGVVKNPDPEASHKSIIEHAFPVEYVDYLRAAAKIRGVVGSQRSYSFLGYNCTSFAADIAKEAGVDIKDDDSSEKIRTFKYKSARVDSPYSLAKFIRQKNEEQAEEQAKKQAEEQAKKQAEEQGEEKSATKDGEKEPSKRKVAEVKEKVKDMSFHEQTDEKMLATIVELAGSKTKDGKLTLQADYDKKGRIERRDLTKANNYDVHQSLMNRLKTNPLFCELQKKFAPEKTEDQYALQLFRTILDSTVESLNKINERVNIEIGDDDSEEYIADMAKPYDLSGLDRQTSIRKLKIARKRDWMKQTFGYVTTTEYLSAVVKNPKILAKAIMRLKEYPMKVESDLDLGDDRIFQFLKEDLDTAVSQDVPSRDTLYRYLAINSYFAECSWSDTLQDQFHISPKELVLRAILEMSQKYSVEKQFATEEGAYDQLSDQEKVEAMISHKGETVSEFIPFACWNKDKLKKLIEEDGLSYKGVPVKNFLRK
ncbi:MAG: cell envelope integrity protein TolA [Eubacterium sp.]|nr:cell envelope integrity protein TolA [Eubacterium sp.]